MRSVSSDDGARSRPTTIATFAEFVTGLAGAPLPAAAGAARR
jgi:hypothetical protein